jgi:hypothetical protein
MICSSVNLLLRMSVSRRNGPYPKSGTSTGSRSLASGEARRRKAALDLTVEDRKGIQIILTTLGYDTRGIDGQFGGGTRNAIRAIQLALNHQPTGYLSRAEYDYIAESQERVRETLGDKAMHITVADLPQRADSRLTRAVEALKGLPIKFGFFEGNLYVAVVATRWMPPDQSRRKREATSRSLRRAARMISYSA